SDSVFAITITLLVLEIHRPAFDRPGLGQRLLDRWADYIAFTVSIIYIGGDLTRPHQRSLGALASARSARGTRLEVACIRNGGVGSRGGVLRQRGGRS